MQGIKTQDSRLCSKQFTNRATFPAPLWTWDGISSIWIVYEIRLRKDFLRLPLLVFPEVTIVTLLLDGETQRWYHSAAQLQFPEFDTQHPSENSWCLLAIPALRTWRQVDTCNQMARGCLASLVISGILGLRDDAGHGFLVSVPMYINTCMNTCVCAGHLAVRTTHTLLRLKKHGPFTSNQIHECRPQS